MHGHLHSPVLLSVNAHTSNGVCVVDSSSGVTVKSPVYKMHISLSFTGRPYVYRLRFFIFVVLQSYWARASSLLTFRDHSQTPTIGRAPLDEGSARHRDLYLTTHNAHNRQQGCTQGGCCRAAAHPQPPKTEIKKKIL
jgi:hypothetical protein